MQQKSTSKAEPVISGFTAQDFKKNVEQNAEQKVREKNKRKDVRKRNLPPVIALNKNIKKENQFRPLVLTKIYNPQGKIDPFVPLFQEKAIAAPIVTQKRKKRVRRTPLERIDLAQLKLTGIILRPAGDKAMVEEATGRGYVVIKGTSIGNNWGKVTEILKDRIIIKEEVEDLLGKVTLEKKEMKIQRPPGEL
ncbi:MAG: pilus assembly protein PilP [Desulfosarcina sp.]|nr:pilus assembly protein PilP [Desulfobacterales bacterium]